MPVPFQAHLGQEGGGASCAYRPASGAGDASTTAFDRLCAADGGANVNVVQAAGTTPLWRADAYLDCQETCGALGLDPISGGLTKTSKDLGTAVCAVVTATNNFKTGG